MSFESLFLEQFKTFINPALLHHQFMIMKKDPNETISRFNHRFHMAYRRMDSPFIVTLPTVIQTYLHSMDYLTMIFLRQLPLIDIDTLVKVFQEATTFTKQANPNKGGNMIVPLPIRNVYVFPPYHKIPWVAMLHYQPQTTILK